jgi:four helix bundle protein
MKEQNVIKEKSYSFALQIVQLFKYLTEEKKEYVLAKQILRCGTSIGANIEEAIGSQSRKEFYSKITIAYKEARETSYWLRILKDSHYIDENQYEILFTQVNEILKIIGAIQKTLKISQLT